MSRFPRSFTTTIVPFLGLVILLFQYVPGSSTSLQSTARQPQVHPRGDFVNNESLATPSTQNSSSIIRRDDYSCGVGSPCSNGACCGVSGFCGYGATYCGTGCTSNCDAVAECGIDAVPSGKTCPLNTCCSQYGFCGTTADFCGTNCQSNCVLNPTPSGSGGGNILQRVIGYYESWSDSLSCHQIAPSDLPLDALTHLNYAFAYIDPTTFDIVTMSSDTPAQLFQTVVGAKSYKSDLQVWLSIGGWTFSDNGTATQAVFGTIAASSTNRQTFANNLLIFLNHYGFDGVDLDWEYPGAPDRGGSPDDTANYVSLLQTIRATFDTSPRALGISFTAPSSYWYLRWFDLPSLLQYADWINLMTYDLHGVWDRNNPIGAIVQGHTNLTEIGYSLDLLWRVNIAPSKVSMGFGFYGRSFQLADVSCSSPGCAFSGAGTAGPCSDASGIMYYYEIMALLKQHPELNPVWDKSAGVKYVVFDTDQWISYDDADTFAQKVTYANTLGLGGALIWASDADDSEYTAHTGLTGKSLAHADTTSTAVSEKYFNVIDAGAIAQNLVGQNGQNCQILTSCTLQESIQKSGCGSGFTKLGWEQGNCGDKYGHSICCPTATAPSSCIWRGGGGDCNGQCHVGEANVFGSSWGGSPTEGNQKKCSRGYKVFCCEAGDWKSVIYGCRWTSNGGSCDTAIEDEVSQQYGSAFSTVFNPISKYCCPKPASLYDCHWVGSQPDCADAKCASDEVAIALNPQGRGYPSCSWGRQKTDCCKVQVQPPAKIICTSSYCDIDPGICTIGDSDGWDSGGLKRSEDSLNGTHLNYLEGRGPKRFFDIAMTGYTTYRLWSRAYPSRGTLFETALARQQVLRQFLRPTPTPTDCADATVTGSPIPDADIVSNTNLPPTGEAEHPIDLSVAPRFFSSAQSRILPNGQRALTNPIASSFFALQFFRERLRTGLPRVTPNSQEFLSAGDRFEEALGSNTNRANFLLTDRSINGGKGLIFTLKAVISDKNLKKAIKDAIAGDATAEDQMLTALRTTVAVFRYIQNEQVNLRIRAVRDLIREQLVIAEAELPGGTGLTALWDEFFPAYMQAVEQTSQDWMTESIRSIRVAYATAAINGSPALNQASVEAILVELENQIKDMTTNVVGP